MGAGWGAGGGDGGGGVGWRVHRVWRRMGSGGKLSSFVQFIRAFIHMTVFEFVHPFICSDLQQYSEW